jgi:L-ascorbate metabolism protein UlaG (beta-lactamase superfamily)
MRIRWLGWAGVEVEAEGERIVIDPLDDAGAVFAPYGTPPGTIPLPEVTAPQPDALAGLVTHLHRDHADAAALRSALAPDTVVYEPVGYGGDRAEQLALVQADREMTAAGLIREPAAPWSTVTVGPFSITALPAVDGTGDPQVSWLIEADGQRVVHLGDTVFHGWWWRFAERFGTPDAVCAPINGARLSFPHRQPASSLPGVMDPEQAALAAELLRAERLVPMHYDGYSFPRVYEPVPDALDRVRTASDRVTVLELGEALEL